MKFTVDWLKDHLETKKGDQQILNKLTDIGLDKFLSDSRKTK